MTERRARWGRGCAALLAASLVLGACWWGGDDDDADDDTAPSSTATDDDGVTDGPILTVAGTTTEAAAAKLGIRLSEGAPSVSTTDSPSVVAGTPLTADEIAALLGRLPEWDVPPADQVEFNRPPQTLPPPLIGDTIESSFPPAADEPSRDVPSGPLQVVRFQPEGAVGVAPFLSVTFDRPMVPIATLDQLEAADVPVSVTPAIEGRWRWIGTRTLRFELVPDRIDRLPAATRFEVEVPAGTTAADGSSLADAVTWSFTTPPPTVRSFVGGGSSLPLDPVFVAVFDQIVDPDDVLAAITLTADGEQRPIRLATPAEVDDDERADAAVDAALDGRAVAFRAATELPADSPVSIVIGPGTPSAEGPLTSAVSETFTGHTFGRLRIRRTECGWEPRCIPGAPLRIVFSNPLDPDAFALDQVAVEPRIPGLRVNVFGDTVELTGATKGRTTYTVTIDGELRDVFGQTLGEDAAVDIRVGSVPPTLFGLDRQWITTDPAVERPGVSITSANHDEVRVRAWAVSPGELGAFRRFLEDLWSDDDPPIPDWTVVMDEVVEIDDERDAFVETTIDLSSAFNQAGSQIVVLVESTLDFGPDDEAYWRNRPTVAWVQQTTLAIDAIVDRDQLVIWTTDLLSGEPVAGVPVELIGDGRVATTDEEGLASVELGRAGVRGLWATAGDRTSFLASEWSDGWKRSDESDESRWYVFDDRSIYRPGETVRLTGWVRRFARSTDAQLALFDGRPTVRYTAWDPQGNELATGTTELNALGGFNLSFDVPAGSNLGSGWVEMQLQGTSLGGTSHSFQIQEFRRPEFEVTARLESPPPFFAARPATVAVDAVYFSGAPLPDAEVNWLVSTRDTTYRPPGWDRFTFGIWQPWWYDDFGDFGRFDVAAEISEECFDCGPIFGDTEYEQFQGRTGPDGSHYLQIDFDGPDVDLPSTVTAEATVFDVNRQAWASRTDLLVHPAEQYVGVRTDRTFVEAGTPIRVDAVVTDVDGELVAGRPVEIEVGRIEWGYVAGVWTEEIVDAESCSFSSTASLDDASMRCEFPTEVGGTYRITAIVTDTDGHRNRSQLTQWVSGGTGRPTRGVDQESVTIVPDRETYEPGDVAELLVQAPFAPAHGIVTVIRDGILSTEAFAAEDGSAVVEVAIEDAHIPNLTVQVDMVGSSPRSADDGTPLPDAAPRPAFATGRIGLSIPPVTRALSVVATPDADALEPGEETSVTIAVNGPNGEPVAGADVAVVVVDEAVLSLTGYQLADPLDVFYQDVWSNVFAQYLRSSVVLARPDLAGGAGAERSDETAAEEPAEEAAADADFAGASPETTSPIQVRTNFDALAVYAPDESTGPDGTVTVAVPLPDSLTRYRVMAVAVDGADRFGKGESTITARLPLQIRPSAPRFLNFGDAAELPVVVQNQTDAPLEVDVAIEVANLRLTGPAGLRVSVPANDRVEIRFPATTEQVGTARMRLVGASGDLADAQEIDLPVYTPATAEAFATYGVVDDDGGAVAQPLLAPTGVFPQFGGLEVGTSSTALQALTDAVLYLHRYPYDSADGYASRIMAVATLRDVLEAFDAGGLPAAAELDERVADDITRLSQLQNDDGGFPAWQRGRQSIPWQSIQAAHALVLARDAGYSVATATLDRALAHLASIEEYIPPSYDAQTKRTLRAYALHVRGVAGDRDPTKAAALYREAGDELQVDAVAWLWPSIDDSELRAEIERRILNAAVETAGAATFATSYEEDAYVIAPSSHKSDGIVLDALLTQRPDSDLIPKVVAGLLGGQTRGRWNNVHENAFVLIALKEYFDTFESITPDFVARAWLGDLYAAEHSFEGRTTDRASSLIPMTEVVGAGDTDLVIAKDGAGRLYYRLGLRYAPLDLELDARDEGFVVERTYEGVDDVADVTRDADGTWRIRAGAEVRVRLTMVADARRTHVALIDPLPAGLEPVNPALATSQTTPPEDDGDVTPYRWTWWWNWFEHQNLRDDRAEAFASIVSAGTYEYTYIARATTPGQFVVPPTRAEEIYAPEVFGRSSTAKVVIG